MSFSDPDSLMREFRDKLDIIEHYFRSTLNLNNVEEIEDVARDGVIFRVQGTTSFRLFISHEFLSDFSEKEIKKLLFKWEIAEKTKTLRKEDMLFVTTEGTFVEGAPALFPVAHTSSTVSLENRGRRTALLEKVAVLEAKFLSKPLFERELGIHVKPGEIAVVSYEVPSGRFNGEVRVYYSEEDGLPIEGRPRPYYTLFLRAV